MDLLSQHEAFLRAIYDAPTDDVPRLVYADFLQESGQEEQARLIRWQCGRGEPSADLPLTDADYLRGLPVGCNTATLALEQLQNPDRLRWDLVKSSPEYFAAQGVKLRAGRITSGEPFDRLFALAAFARLTELNLEGATILEDEPSESMFQAYRIEPVITTAGVEALVRHRGVRRITALILTNNNLDNDAARALVKSPYLDNLKRLDLLEGNRLRGKVWQQVIERFGEDVVG